MDFFEVIDRRRSCRRFTAEAVPDAVVEKSLDSALKAPNSSNMQCWEFYWVKSEDKKAKLKEYCFSQGAARTAQHLIVCVARRDVWRRNQKLLLHEISQNPNLPKVVQTYYKKLIPFMYIFGPLGIFGWFKKILFTVVGFFRAVPRTPHLRSEFFEMITKSCALACENLMLAIVAQGYACCPMEGFDEWRVKKLLKLSHNSHVVMVVGIGRADPKGIWGEQFRIDKNLIIKNV